MDPAEEMFAAKTDAEILLSQGEFENAISCANDALRLSVALHGADSLENVPCYLLLAEANLGTGVLPQAEWFLSQANWAVVKGGEGVTHHVRSLVHRCFGKLFAAQGRTDEALTHLASNVYYCARESGPMSIDAADGYFLLASVFHAMEPGKTDAALAFFAKVLDAWRAVMEGDAGIALALAAAEDPAAADDERLLSDVVVGEAVQMVRKILEVQRDAKGTSDSTVGQTLVTLGLIYHYAGDTPEAEKVFDEARALAEKAGDKPLLATAMKRQEAL